MALASDCALRASASSASRPLRAISTVGAVRLEHAGQGEDVAHVVLDHENAAALEGGSRGCARLQHLLLGRRELRLHLVQEQRHLVEQPLRRAGILDDDRPRVAAEALLLVARQRTARVHDDRRKRHLFLLRHLLEQLVAGRIRQIEIEDHAVEGRRGELAQRLVRGLDVGDLHIAVAEELADAFSLTRIILDDQHAADALRELDLEPLQGLDQLLALGGLQRITRGARARAPRAGNRRPRPRARGCAGCAGRA